MKHKLLRFLSLCAAAALLAIGQPGAAQQNVKTYLPVVNRATGVPPADEAAQRITVPAGFAIRIFADNLAGRPRLMTVGPDGHLYVALHGSGSIARLPDRDANGLADGVEIAASGLTSPHNLEWLGAWMYVAQTGRIDRMADNNRDGVYETRQQVTNNIPGSGGHSTRTLHFGPDGKLYVSAGSSCNVCEESDPRRAAILRFNPDGTIPPDNPFANDPDTRKRPVWAWGLRNSVDFLWSPDGVLWADHNGSDGLGDDLPPEEIVIPVQQGRSHGWPYCYTPVLGLNQPQKPEVRDTRLALPPGFTCAQAVPARLTGPAHSAPLGMSSGSGAAFPAAYRDDLFVAYHGSWNTTAGSARDCKVERVVVENGQVVGSQTFANGWRAAGKPCGDAATWGRPADVAVGSDGSLFISDDKGSRIYRVVYIGP